MFKFKGVFLKLHVLIIWKYVRFSRTICKHLFRLTYIRWVNNIFRLKVIVKNTTNQLGIQHERCLCVQIVNLCQPFRVCTFLFCVSWIQTNTMVISRNTIDNIRKLIVCVLKRRPSCEWMCTYAMFRVTVVWQRLVI